MWVVDRRGWGVLRAAALGAALAASAAGAAPLDDTGGAFNQGEWARMLVGRMGQTGALAANAPAEEAAALLGTRGVNLTRDAKAASPVSSDGAQRTWRWTVDLPRTGTWLLTVANTTPGFASVDKNPSKLLAAGGADGASDVGLFPLAAGRHSVTVSGTQSTAPSITLVAGCHPVVPAGGWLPSAKLSYGNLGRTLVQALRQNGRLPAQDGLAPVAAPNGTVTLDVPSEGTYTVLLSGKALERATYRLGGCEETVPGAPTADGWREGTTVLLEKGAQTLALAGTDTRFKDGRVRLVRRASADAEYLAVLQSLGVRLDDGTGSGKTTGSLEPAGSPRTGLARRAQGDSRTGLAALAGRTVTRDAAQRILDTPVVRRLLARGATLSGAGGSKNGDTPGDEDLAGTLDEPVTGTLQDLQEPDPE